MNKTLQLSTNEWKKKLTEEEFRVLRLKETEAPFSGKYNIHFKKGKYTCTGCSATLFNSDAKFESGCGWPSFSNRANDSAIEYIDDNSHEMHRTEVICKNCKGHLGHVFNDGPKPSQNRYCINSVALNFKSE